jgi:hypothetical protein
MALGPTDLNLIKNEAIADAVEQVMDKYLKEAVAALVADEAWHHIRIELPGSCLPSNIRGILGDRYIKAGWSELRFVPRIDTTEVIFMR